MRVRRRAGTAAALISACLLSVVPALGARPWYWHVEQAERALSGGDATAAERHALEALAVRAHPACHLRTYGLLHADYLPYFLLGVARIRQGKLAEAREAFEREDAEGVIHDCPSTRLQALDLQSFLSELSSQGEPAGSPAELDPPPDDGRVAAEIRGSAEEAVSRARLAVGTAEKSAGGEAAQAIAKAESLLSGAPTLAETAEAGTEARRAMQLLPQAAPAPTVAPRRRAGGATWVELCWSLAASPAPPPVLVPVRGAP